VDDADLISVWQLVSVGVFIQPNLRNDSVSGRKDAAASRGLEIHPFVSGQAESFVTLWIGTERLCNESVFRWPLETQYHDVILLLYWFFASLIVAVDTTALGFI
jgi:hypothetical protein